MTDSDGTVVKVEFYRDSNKSGSLEIGTDVKLGEDTSMTALYRASFAQKGDGHMCFSAKNAVFRRK